MLVLFSTPSCALDTLFSKVIPIRGSCGDFATTIAAQDVLRWFLLVSVRVCVCARVSPVQYLRRRAWVVLVVVCFVVAVSVAVFLFVLGCYRACVVLLLFLFLFLLLLLPCLLWLLLLCSCCCCCLDGLGVHRVAGDSYVDGDFGVCAWVMVERRLARTVFGSRLAWRVSSAVLHGPSLESKVTVLM